VTTCSHAGSTAGRKELRTARLDSLVIDEAGVVRLLLVAILVYFVQVNTPLALQALTFTGLSSSFTRVALVGDQKQLAPHLHSLGTAPNMNEYKEAMFDRLWDKETEVRKGNKTYGISLIELKASFSVRSVTNFNVKTF
jgi:hypothetical protein